MQSLVGRIQRLELWNFRSYKGFHSIGPLSNLTAIVGVNVSGASNLFHAISFVLGVGSGKRPASKLIDSIYSFEVGGLEYKERKAYVRLVYQFPDGAHIEFMRTISADGAVVYNVDGETVSLDQYNQKLNSIGVYQKACNFLVSEFEVHSIARKDPRELTALLEQVSGSDEYRTRYKELKRETKKAREVTGRAEQKRFRISMQLIEEKEKQQEENLKELEEKRAAATLAVKEAQDQETRVEAEFLSVKRARHQRFMEAFQHISGNIDKIYKQMTDGGTAYLRLEKIHEPYLHGIKYSARPQGYFSHSSDSKNVAALALLFSIHSYRPSPFFVLDEVDDGLDNLSVSKLAEFIRSRSCMGTRAIQDADQGTGFQCIVIAREDSFCDKADALVLVYMDSDRSCSRTLTINFTNNGEF